MTKTAHLALATVLVLSCGDSPPLREVPLEGVARSYVGAWYTEEGVLGLEVIGSRTAGYRLRAAVGPTWDLVGAVALEEGLRIEVLASGRRETIELTHFSGYLPPGSGAGLYADHNYWLYHQPSKSWLAARAAERAAKNGLEMSEAALDKLIRAL